MQLRYESLPDRQCRAATTFQLQTGVVPQPILYTDKKDNQIFLTYKEIQNGAIAK